MIKDSTKKTKCLAGPCTCGSIDSQVFLSDLDDNPSRYSVDCFCSDCESAHKKYTWNTEIVNTIPKELKEAASQAYTYISEKIFPTRNIFPKMTGNIWASAVKDVMGYDEDKQWIMLPVWNTWNNLVGYIKIGATSYRAPTKSKAEAMVLSTTYKPEILVIVESPVTALAIRIGSALSPFKLPVSVMYPLPGKYPIVDAYQRPKHTVAFIEDPDLHEHFRQHLVEKTVKDAILVNRKFDIDHKSTAFFMRDIVCRGEVFDGLFSDKLISVDSRPTGKVPSISDDPSGFFSEEA